MRSLLNRLTAKARTVDLSNSMILRTSVDRRFDVVNEGTRSTLDNDFAHGTSVEGNHWSATRHRLHDGESERLVKVD